MKISCFPILLFGIFVLASGCSITYRLNGIEYPVSSDKEPVDANGWSIRTGDARESEYVSGFSVRKYLVIDISATNNNGKKRKFKYEIQKYDDKNLEYMLGHSFSFRNSYNENPDSYDIADFFKDDGLKISYQSSTTGKIRSHACSGIPQSYFWGALKSTRTKRFTSDWISPGETHNVTIYCILPNDGENLTLDYYGFPFAAFGRPGYSEEVKESLEME